MGLRIHTFYLDFCKSETLSCLIRIGCYCCCCCWCYPPHVRVNDGFFLSTYLLSTSFLLACTLYATCDIFSPSFFIQFNSNFIIYIAEQRKCLCTELQPQQAMSIFFLYLYRASTHSIRWKMCALLPFLNDNFHINDCNDDGGNDAHPHFMAFISLNQHKVNVSLVFI